MCFNNIIINSDQYNFCLKQQLIINKKIVNQAYYLQNFKTQIFVHTDSTQKSVIDIQVYNYNVNVFVLFGLVGASQNVVDSKINISLNFPVFQGALICVQCDVYVTNCTLVFIATGKAISCVLIEARSVILIQQTFIQFRISSFNSSGIANKVNHASVIFSITDCKLTGSNLLQSGFNGYISCQVLVPISVVISSFFVCVGNTSNIGNESEIVSFTGAEIDQCDLCDTQFVVYGLCLDSLKYGTQVGNVLECYYPFIFQDIQCTCDQGYVLDSKKCVNILQALRNVTSTETGTLSNRIDDIATELLNVDARISNNASSLQTQIINTQSELESQMSANVSQLTNIMFNNVAALENNILGNASILIDQVNLTQGTLENYIIGNATVLDWRIYNNISELNYSLMNIGQIMQFNLFLISQNFSSVDLNISNLKYNQSQLLTDLEILYQQYIDQIQFNITYFKKQINCTNVIGQLFINGSCLNVSCSVYGQQRVKGICSCPNLNAIIRNNSCVCPNASSLIYSACVCPAYSSLINDECVCDAITGRVMQSGVCVCPVGYVEVNNQCESISCPANSNLVNGVCVCNVISGQTLIGGVCVCSVLNAFVSGSACICPTNSNLVNGVCLCDMISGQVMDNGICVCSTANAFVSGSACTCGVNSLNISDVCNCPTNSTLVSGVCTCNVISGQIIVNGACICQTAGAFISGPACTCGMDSTNISNTCGCPAGSNLVNEECKCNVISGQIMVSGACVCSASHSFVNGSACVCPTNSNIISDVCTCNAIPGQNIVNGACVCETIGAFVISGVCSCGINSTNISNTCGCPAYSSLINDECVCDAITGRVMQSGVCVCPVGYVEVNNQCESISCPANSNLVNGVCVCNVISGQTLIGGVCVCSVLNAFVSGSACICPTNSNLVNGVCLCDMISGQVMDNGICVCSTANAFVSGSACTCGVNSLNISDVCNCPTNSTLVSGVCTAMQYLDKLLLTERAFVKQLELISGPACMWYGFNKYIEHLWMSSWLQFSERRMQMQCNIWLNYGIRSMYAQHLIPLLMDLLVFAQPILTQYLMFVLAMRYLDKYCK
ncbi:Conserved_hypothetical protein [Hexamita inflata]|uniref:Uncharacterized protein n=1 Tax=Hexamita inflata TaxID=28002 RepID=A0AA86PSL5_9EUKA|nr:Conserved hypothetical protein [Hexamita inflata]